MKKDSIALSIDQRNVEIEENDIKFFVRNHEKSILMSDPVIVSKDLLALSAHPRTLVKGRRGWSGERAMGAQRCDQEEKNPLRAARTRLACRLADRSV